MAAAPIDRFMYYFPNVEPEPYIINIAPGHLRATSHRWRGSEK